MRAAVFHETGRPLSIENVPDPRPAPDQVIIEVARSGICGSDLHVTEYGAAPDGTILTANQKFLDAMGYGLAEIKGRHHSMFAEPAYAAIVDARSAIATRYAPQLVTCNLQPATRRR